MNRRDVLALEAFYAATMRREAMARASINSAAADQLNRFAEAAERRVEAIKCGPLFDQTPKPQAEGPRHEPQENPRR